MKPVGSDAGRLLRLLLPQTILAVLVEHEPIEHRQDGGDEFSAVLIGMTEAEAKKKIEKFTMQPRYITQNGEKRPFIFHLGMQNIRRIVMMYRN